MKRIIPIIALIVLLTNSSAWAADATAALDLNSAYVWRGITFNDGLVAQPSIDVAHKGLGINVWGNFDLNDYNGLVDENNFNEIDLTVSYNFSYKKLDMGVGIIEYLFPAAGLGTRELYASFGMGIIGGLSAGLGIYYDVDEFNGLYSDLSLTFAWDITDQWGLEAGALVAYADKDWAQGYFGTDGGFHHYSLSLGLSYALTEAWSLGANINYVDTMDKDVLPEVDIPNGILGLDTQVYGGISVAWAF